MTVVELARRLAVRDGAFVLLCAGLLAAFELLVAQAVAAVDVGGVLQSLLSSLPPMMREMVEQVMFAGLSPRGLIAFGWSHPIAQALGAGVAIMLATRAIAGECEAGTIELALGAPVSRAAYLLAHAAAGLAALALVSAAGTAATALAVPLFRLDPIGPAALLRLSVNHVALQAAWFGVTLALSAGGREGGRVAGTAFLLALASYVADVIGRLWTKAAFVLPYSLYHHFVAQDILVRDAGVGRPVAVLGTVAAVGMAIAWWRFARRDLP